MRVRHVRLPDERLRYGLPVLPLWTIAVGALLLVTRLCIGAQFAWMEGILLLVTIGQRWCFEPTEHDALLCSLAGRDYLASPSGAAAAPAGAFVMAFA